MWDPDSYLELMAREVPDYGRLQDKLVEAVADCGATTVLDLGIGSGLTAQRVADTLPQAHIVGIDDSAEMLAAAVKTLDSSRTRLAMARLQDPLPAGPFDLVVSMLAVHHLDGPGKADLFRRVARAMRPRGRFVLADLIIPADPQDVVTPIDGVIDTPSTLPEQLTWMRGAGLSPEVLWKHRDLVVIVAHQQP